MEEGERSNPLYMLKRNVVRGARFVTREGRCGSVFVPNGFGVFALQGRKQEILMIAAQADDLVMGPSLKVHKEFDDPAAIGPSIDIVSQEDELRTPFAGVPLTELNKALQLVKTPVDISNGIRLTQSGAPRNPRARSARIILYASCQSSQLAKEPRSWLTDRVQIVEQDRALDDADEGPDRPPQYDEGADEEIEEGEADDKVE